MRPGAAPRNRKGKIGPMARPNKQVERRHDIMDAAIALIERHDLATLKLADVAEQLGLTTNAVRYYFKDMTQLLSELALRSDVRFYDERLKLQSPSGDTREQLVLTIAAGLPTGPDDAEWRAIWRAVLSAGFELDQRRDVQGIYHRQVDLYTDLLLAGGRRVRCSGCSSRARYRHDADVHGGLLRLPDRRARSRVEPGRCAAVDAAVRGVGDRGGVVA